MPNNDDTIEILPRERHQELPPRLHHVQRRVVGVEVLPLALSATAVALALALALLIGGHLIAAIVLLVVAVVLGGFLRFGIRHEPRSEVARASLRASDRTRSRARLAVVAVRAWSGAAAEIVRERGRELRLRYRLRDQLRPLGEAVYRDQPERAEAIKAQAAALERELLDRRREAAAAVGAARGAIERERALIEPTESLPRQRRDAPEP